MTHHVSARVAFAAPARQGRMPRRLESAYHGGMGMLILRALALGLVIVLTAPPAGAQRRVEVYRMKYRTAEELLPIVQTVLAGSGSASVDRATNSLVLVGDQAAVGEVLQLLAVQDRKLRTVVLHYDNKRLRDLEARGFDVRWTVQAGSFRIGNVRRPRGSGSSVSVRANEVDRSSDETLSGVLRVQEGETGRIETGQTVPFTTGNRFGTNTQLVTASTGFEAKPRILGDGRVQVDLQPFSGRFGRGGTIESSGASTIVTVAPGETVIVGGLERSSDSSNRALLSGVQEGSSQDDSVLMLRVDVE